MRLLLDENLSERLVGTLAPRFPDSLHVRTLDMGGDEDFVSLSVVRGPPPKVIWLNVGNARTDAVARLLLASADGIESFVAHPDAGFLALGFGETARD